MRSAPAQNRGFQVNRYEPTAAGEWSFAVAYPYYSSTCTLAAGITLDYGHHPLVLGHVDPSGSFHASTIVIAHQLTGHVDLAGSSLDRALITLSLPVILAERGQPAFGVAPVQSITAGDPRLGIMARLYGQPYGSAFSISTGGQIWLPLRRFMTDLPRPRAMRSSAASPRWPWAGSSRA